MREDGISVKKCPKFIAHNFVVISFEDMATKKQQQQEKAKTSLQEISRSWDPFVLYGMLGKWRTSMVSAIPGQRSSVRV